MDTRATDDDDVDVEAKKNRKKIVNVPAVFTKKKNGNNPIIICLTIYKYVVHVGIFFSSNNNKQMNGRVF